MTTRQYSHPRFRRLILPALAAVYLGYFGFWAFHGYYGIWAKTRLEGEAARLETELADLSARRLILEGRVTLLRSESVDSDMLDEQARQALNLLRPDEVVLDGALQKSGR